MATYNKAHVCKRVGHDWAINQRQCKRCLLIEDDLMAVDPRMAIWNAGQRQAYKKRYGLDYWLILRRGTDGRILKAQP